MESSAGPEYNRAESITEDNSWQEKSWLQYNRTEQSSKKTQLNEYSKEGKGTDKYCTVIQTKTKELCWLLGYLVEHNHPYEWSFLSPDLLSLFRLLFLDPSPCWKTQTHRNIVETRYSYLLIGGKQVATQHTNLKQQTETKEKAKLNTL